MNENPDYELLFNELRAKYDDLRFEINAVRDNNGALRQESEKLRAENEALRTQFFELRTWLNAAPTNPTDVDVYHWWKARPKDST